MRPEDVRVCVLRIEGTNCEDEMYEAFKMVGASPEKVHLKQLTGQSPSSSRGMSRITTYSHSLEDSLPGIM